MKRASIAAVPILLACAAAAMADEYVVTPFTGGHVEPPPIPRLGEDNPTSVTRIIPARQDGRTVVVSLPFQFPFFGRLYGAASISEDGWLAFGATTATEPDNPLLPENDLPNAVVAALWDDLRTGTGSVLTFTLGTAPDRTFVVAWHRVTSARRSSRDDLSFEVLLHEGSGIVELAYSPGRGNALSFTAGIENETGTRAFGAANLTNANSGIPDVDRRFTPHATPVTGTITRERPVASAAGLGATTEVLPVDGADVALVREDTEETIATTRTDASGAFALTSIGLDGAPTLAVDLFASGEESLVTAADGTRWKRRIATGIVPSTARVLPTVHLDASVDATDPNFRKALNIQQAAHRGFAWAGAAIDAAGLGNAPLRKAFQRLEIRWTPGGGTASGYVPATSTVSARATIADVAVANSTTTPDAYDDDVVLREYAQHLLATMAQFPGALTAHVWTPPPPPPPPATPLPGASATAAFVDGFSFWFAAAVAERAQFIDTIDASSATVFDLEGPSPAASGSNVAGAVAASLWDLVDPANEPRDDFDGSLPATGYAVFATLDQRTFNPTSGVVSVPVGSTAWTAATFFDAWRAKLNAAETSATARLFIRHATLADDTFEPNDRAGEEKPFPAGSPKLTGLVLNVGDEDRFSFTVADHVVAVAVSFADAAQVEISILDPSNLDVDGQPVVVATSASATSPVVATTPQGLAAGTYVARIAWKSGTVVNYTLSIFDPPVLVTVLPAEWTAGLPYSRTLTATGGVPPVTFALQGSPVPGLSLVGGTRIAGTPTTPGDYVLRVTMTDLSGAGPLSAGDAPLHVNEAITLPQVFGVRANAPLDVIVGRGGTGTTWTAVQLPPADSGLVLSSGSMLRLSGTAGDPRWFKISARAVDTVGASLATAESMVVVSSPLAALLPNLSVAQGDTFGFWFDAIAGSRVTLHVRFAAAKSAPRFLTLVDDRGAALSLRNGALIQRGGTTRIANVAIPRTARHFLVFTAPAAFSGVVAATGTRIRPPTRFSGVATIGAPGAKADIPFTAIAGSTMRVVMQSAPTPDAAVPDAIEILKPDGTRLEPLPNGTIDRHGRRKTVRRIRLPVSGDYLLRIGAKGGTTGTIVYEATIVSPRNATFLLP